MGANQLLEWGMTMEAKVDLARLPQVSLSRSGADSADTVVSFSP